MATIGITNDHASGYRSFEGDVVPDALKGRAHVRFSRETFLRLVTELPPKDNNWVGKRFDLRLVRDGKHLVYHDCAVVKPEGVDGALITYSSAGPIR